MVRKVNILNILKKILLCFWWQDIEKSHFLPRILCLFVSVALSFCIYAWMYEANINIIFKLIISIYLIVNILLFWPAHILLSEKNMFIGEVFYVFKNISVLFSFIVLFKYFMKKEQLDYNKNQADYDNN
ncbi:hypothetical protein [Hathewaya limosa]|uniref:Uncharacterized protein n=1 Tax=Hathewaya limosa TaxID=1536 RepID=A0ABU0JTB3_HATLI|nr:hypothetical protein [Hathewaya limosa]MDQ0480299.1 hypothetical protein [Hathewaya limosa]